MIYICASKVKQQVLIIRNITISKIKARMQIAKLPILSKSGFPVNSENLDSEEYMFFWTGNQDVE